MRSCLPHEVTQQNGHTHPHTSTHSQAHTNRPRQAHTPMDSHPPPNMLPPPAQHHYPKLSWPPHLVVVVVRQTVHPQMIKQVTKESERNCPSSVFKYQWPPSNLLHPIPNPAAPNSLSEMQPANPSTGLPGPAPSLFGWAPNPAPCCLVRPQICSPKLRVLHASKALLSIMLTHTDSSCGQRCSLAALH